MLLLKSMDNVRSLLIKKIKIAILFVLDTALIAVVVAGICYNKFDIFAEDDKDVTPPVIEVLQDNLRFFDDEDIIFFDYVEVSDDSGEYSITLLNADEAKLPGERFITFEATDSSGNKAYATINVTIISSEEWAKHIIDSTANYAYRRYENVTFEQKKGDVDIDAFNLAQSFIGMPGACNEVAQAFINAYFGDGYSIYNVYSVSYDEAKPGDVIFYTNGGIGLQHYAVYLGGSSALQGNINGTTVIGSVYMSHGSAPMFYRIYGTD